MLLDYDKCREQLPKVLSGELDLPLEELWPLLYYETNMVRGNTSADDQQHIENCTVLMERLLKKADPDDDMDTILDALYQVLRSYVSVDKVLDMLMESGYSFSEPLVKGRTPAYILLNRNRIKSWGADKNEYEEALAKTVADYFSVESLETLNAEGTSAAHAAVRYNHFEVVEAMLKKGVNINLTEDTPSVAGTTFLHIACEHVYPQLVKMLMAAGADDTLKNEKEETAAHIAASVKVRYKEIRNEDRVEMLKALEHVDIPGKNGTTPLMLAQDPQSSLTFTLTPVLIEKGADVNRADNDGNTALMLHTFWYCFKDVVKAMVKAGYDINARNRHGDTVLHYVMKNGNSEMAVYLIKKGADVNIANDKQVTPAQIAVEKGLDEILAFL